MTQFRRFFSLLFDSNFEWHINRSVCLVLTSMHCIRSLDNFVSLFVQQGYSSGALNYSKWQQIHICNGQIPKWVPEIRLPTFCWTCSVIRQSMCVGVRAFSLTIVQWFNTFLFLPFWSIHVVLCDVFRLFFFKLYASNVRRTNTSAIFLFFGVSPPSIW